MREYFTIAVKENSNENLGLLAEKLNAGFNVDRYYEVGKGGIFILEKFTPNNETLNLARNTVGGIMMDSSHAEAPTRSRY
jgi:hypothetical protein